MRLATFILACAMVLPLAASGRAEPDTAKARTDASAVDLASAELLASEDARFRAQIAGDIPTVAAAMTNDCLYTHASGRMQTKAEYLAALGGGGASPTSIATRDRSARVFGAVGVVHGTRVATLGQRTLVDTYLAVYLRQFGRWRLFAWQTSLSPPTDRTPVR